ncbi:MAG: tRNA dihydrouridine(20/20a) synthase DusA, partial [Acidobacteria bacterium]|nr:tRNA dihydrouridine(20/20a) synthase DusA [Acidobacteriota bacterium]
GRFGACLMAEPERVARAVAAMAEAVTLPITVKHRIGIDEQDRYEDLYRFVEVVSAAPCARFSVHARKAWLQGLSPKENRTIPPLRYEDVYRLKQELPHLEVEINGGIRTVAEAKLHLARVDGVMVGRAAYEDPFEWATADRQLFGSAAPPPTRREIVEALLPYVESWRRRDLPLHRITRHLLGLFAGQPGAKAWKRHLSENAHFASAGAEVLEAGLARVPADVLDLRPDSQQPGVPDPEPAALLQQN